MAISTVNRRTSQIQYERLIMSFYRALVQQAIRFHGDVVAVVETTIELPDFYTPLPRTWLAHPRLDGRAPIIIVGYDAGTGRLVLTLGVGATALAETDEEWLAAHPDWRKVPDEQATLRSMRCPKKPLCDCDDCGEMPDTEPPSDDWSPDNN
jgi:hypothetical protein